jgi:hypothetical protein
MFGSSSVASGIKVAGLASDRLFSPTDASVESIGRFVADHFLGCQAPFWYLTCLCNVCLSNKLRRRTYGKDNRVLHTAKLSQEFKVAPPSRTWQSAGISTGRTKIGVTGPEMRISNHALRA